MLPVLFQLGPITIYSFGVSLFLMVMVASFLVWREARKRGLSEEKILDVLFLSIILAVISGRALYVYTHWPVFSEDISRIFLFFKYPGVSYQAAVLGGGLATLLFAFGLGLEVFLVADIFSLAILPASAIGFLGCYLDGCYADTGFLGGLLILLLVGGILLNLAAHRLTHSVGLLDYSRRYGLFFLTYLIFLLLSFLMLGTNSRLLEIGYLLGVLVSVIVILARYVGLFRILFKKIYDRIPKSSPYTN